MQDWRVVVKGEDSRFVVFEHVRAKNQNDAEAMIRRSLVIEAYKK